LVGGGLDRPRGGGHRPQKGLDVTVVEAMTGLCQRTVPPEISEYLARLHSKHGTHVILGAGVAGLRTQRRRHAGGENE